MANTNLSGVDRDTYTVFEHITEAQSQRREEDWTQKKKQIDICSTKSESSGRNFAVVYVCCCFHEILISRTQILAHSNVAPPQNTRQIKALKGNCL